MYLLLPTPFLLNLRLINDEQLTIKTSVETQSMSNLPALHFFLEHTVRMRSAYYCTFVLQHSSLWDINRERRFEATVTMLQVFVQGQSLHTLEISPEATVEALKSALAVVEGISAEEQVLSYGGVPLEDECVLADSVPELATLNVNARVVGGKLMSDVRNTKLYLALTIYT